MAGFSLIVGAAALAIAVIFCLLQFLNTPVDPREPPLVQPRIPYFGHIIGMLTEGPLYLRRIRYVNC